MRTAAHVSILIIITQGIYVNYICSIRIYAKNYKTLGTLLNVVCFSLKFIKMKSLFIEKKNSQKGIAVITLKTNSI